MIEHFQSIMHKGGPVMWPLLALSVVSVALSFERALAGGRLPVMQGGGTMTPGAFGGMGGSSMPDFGFTALEDME